MSNDLTSKNADTGSRNTARFFLTFMDCIYFPKSFNELIMSDKVLKFDGSLYPVSYTHLDVYKRQEQTLSASPAISGIFLLYGN